MITVGIITVSDRATSGQYADRSGPALRAACETHGWKVEKQVVVSDDVPRIQDQINSLRATCTLLLLTGGTGVAERDVTPEAIRGLPHRELPGFGEVMRAKSFEKFPHAILSRSLAAAIGRSLVIALPGSPKGAGECLEFVAAAIPHAIEIIVGAPTDHGAVNAAPKTPP